MREAIFTYEGIVNYCQTHFSKPKPENNRFRFSEQELEHLDAQAANIRQNPTPQFGFVVDLIGNGSGPMIRNPIRHQALFDQPNLLDFKYFLDSIHPGYRQAYIWFGQASYMMMAHPSIREILSEGLELRYVFTVPLCRNHHQVESKRVYEWWQQNAQILRLSDEKILLAHFNRYTFLNSYQSVISQNGAIFSDIINPNSENETASLFQILKACMLPALLDSLPANEGKMLQAHLQGKHSIKEIADSTDYSLDTVKTYQSRLLKRINPPYPLFPDKSFTTVKDAIGFLSRIIS
ncbi:MAG: hypothetical protein AAFQ87_19905 [Bacteroidota bacterium]